MAGEGLVKKALQAIMQARAPKHVADPAQRAANLARFQEGTPPEIASQRWYHGKAGDWNDTQRGEKLFLTPDANFAEGFAIDATTRGGDQSPNIMPFHVGVKNPFDYENAAHIDFVRNNARLTTMSPEQRTEFYDQLGKGDWQSVEHPDVQRVLRKNYDSFFVREMNDEGQYLKNLGVYDPGKSLKSATGNLGTFDPNSPRVTEATGGFMGIRKFAREQQQPQGKTTERVMPPSPTLAQLNDLSMSGYDPVDLERAMDVAREVQAPSVAAAPPAPAPVVRELTIPASRPAPQQQTQMPENLSRALWEIYNRTENPADFVRADEQMVRERMTAKDGGETTASRRRKTIAEQMPLEQPQADGEGFQRMLAYLKQYPVRQGEAQARAYEPSLRDVIGGAIAGEDPNTYAGMIRGRAADALAGSRGLEGSGTLGFGALDVLPRVGAALQIGDAAKAMAEGDYASAAVMGAIPAAIAGRGQIANAAKRAMELARQYAPQIGATAAVGATMAPQEAEASFAGRLAKTANLKKLRAAEKMAASGADRADIIRKTGWFQGGDGKWRFEIPDDKSYFTWPKDVDARAMEGRPNEAGQFIKHDALMAAYPDAAKIETRPLDLQAVMGKGIVGGYAPQTGMFLDESLKHSPSAGRSTTLHELQHYIQGLEGFSGGGNSYMAPNDYRKIAGEVEARNVQKRMDMTPEQRMQAYPWETQDIPEKDQVYAGGGTVKKALDFIRAYHGSPHKFDKFDASKIGTGEGNQSYGHGLYFAQAEPTARSYRDILSASKEIPQMQEWAQKNPMEAFDLAEQIQRAAREVGQNADSPKAFNMIVNRLAGLNLEGAHPAHNRSILALNEVEAAVPNNVKDFIRNKFTPAQGHMYEVGIHADPQRLLDWDRAYEQQSPFVQKALRELNLNTQGSDVFGPKTGKDLYGDITFNGSSTNSFKASEALRSLDVPGIKYLDQGSRGVGQGTSNYVVFDPNIVEIMRRYDKGGAVKRAIKLARQYVDPPTTKIQDWKWRPLPDVQADLGLTQIPPHVQQFGDYMREVSDKAGREGLSPDDLIRAFTTTRASIQRQAVPIEKVQAAGLPVQGEGKIRPEGAWAEWLMTPTGRRFVGEAAKGNVDADAVSQAIRIMAPFGKHETDIPEAMTWAAKNLPGREQAASDLVSRGAQMASSPSEWRGFTQDIRGVGPSKSGFLASLLGRGDLPTLDARQIILHTGEPTKGASKFISRGQGVGGQEAVDRLAARQAEMALETPEQYKPFYQHLAHHAVWDKAGNDVTTHDDVMRAMRSGFDQGGAAENEPGLVDRALSFLSNFNPISSAEAAQKTKKSAKITKAA